MTVILTRYFENLRTLLTSYTRLKAGGAWPYPDPVVSVAGDPIQNNILNLMRLDVAKEIGKKYDS